MKQINSDKKKRSLTQKIGLFLGPILFLVFIFLSSSSQQNPAVFKMAGIALLMATWWITEAIPIAITALIPIILFPLTGISSGKVIAPTYFNSIIFLFLGGFLIALAMEKWNLHKRIALNIISAFGGKPQLVVLGFMAASAFLSMWIANTATTLMMVPIALAIVYQIEKTYGEKESSTFVKALLLGVAYAASIGGIATLVGTPPNLAFVRIYEINFPQAPAITFGQWSLLALPISISSLVVAWLILTRVVFRFDKALKIDLNVVNKEKAKLPKMSFEEKCVAIVFSTLAVLWIFRSDLNFGFLSIPGWSNLLPYPKNIDDGTVAITMAFILFLIPSRSPSSTSSTILDINIFKKVPWHIIILFGGGFALAKGFKISGLSQFIGSQFSQADINNPLSLISTITGVITFLTELTSNTATTEMILPILAAVSESLKVDPLLLMIPATLAASFAFMMPVATPPNAIVFGSNRLKISDMVKAGILLNIVGIILISVFVYFLFPIIF